ncbi:DUF4917 family protein [Zhongshania aliphaticivorans]|uniref:DUF4917 family protein n=1 Tax=Zhongshania aliphaticivorans TaxID=1470434 RepID=UPI0012E6CEF9|nr:DUF4917 family protein [Zhongshania aliphaticivorans]CAA0081237.1 Uncharacterised protein [Zhongshania aliphaticivorans]
MTQLRTFEDCMAQAGTAKKHLMLGNGFSVSLFPSIFNYKRLAENIESERINMLFDAIDTHDFEFVMRRLLEAVDIVQHYDSSEGITEYIHEDIEELKRTLIHVISKSHPPKPSEITDHQYESCRKFLLNFEKGKTYTFNYDLILYWVLMHFNDDKELKLPCDDGFRYPHSDEYVPDEERDTSLHWEIGRESGQSTYYIHGAMHIFSDGSDIEKLSYANLGVPLAEQVKQAIDQDRFPVFISEGSTDHKLARIKKNGYLSRTFSSLKSITGYLFIFGHSIRDEDDHVFDFINQNNRNLKMFIGLFGSPLEPHNQVIINKVERWRKSHPFKTFEFYDSSSVDVWGASSNA